jgi:hypothetical protein
MQTWIPPEQSSSAEVGALGGMDLRCRKLYTLSCRKPSHELQEAQSSIPRAILTTSQVASCLVRRSVNGRVKSMRWAALLATAEARVELCWSKQAMAGCQRWRRLD